MRFPKVFEISETFRASRPPGPGPYCYGVIRKILLGIIREQEEQIRQLQKYRELAEETRAV